MDLQPEGATTKAEKRSPNTTQKPLYISRCASELLRAVGKQLFGKELVNVSTLLLHSCDWTSLPVAVKFG